MSLPNDADQDLASSPDVTDVLDAAVQAGKPVTAANVDDFISDVVAVYSTRKEEAREVLSSSRRQLGDFVTWYNYTIEDEDDADAWLFAVVYGLPVFYNSFDAQKSVLERFTVLFNAYMRRKQYSGALQLLKRKLSAPAVKRTLDVVDAMLSDVTPSLKTVELLARYAHQDSPLVGVPKIADASSPEAQALRATRAALRTTLGMDISPNDFTVTRFRIAELPPDAPYGRATAFMTAFRTAVTTGKLAGAQNDANVRRVIAEFPGLLRAQVEFPDVVPVEPIVPVPSVVPPPAAPPPSATLEPLAPNWRSMTGKEMLERFVTPGQLRAAVRSTNPQQDITTLLERAITSETGKSLAQTIGDTNHSQPVWKLVALNMSPPVLESTRRALVYMIMTWYASAPPVPAASTVSMVNMTSTPARTPSAAALAAAALLTGRTPAVNPPLAPLTTMVQNTAAATAARQHLTQQLAAVPNVTTKQYSGAGLELLRKAIDNLANLVPVKIAAKPPGRAPSRRRVRVADMLPANDGASASESGWESAASAASSSASTSRGRQRVRTGAARQRSPATRPGQTNAAPAHVVVVHTDVLSAIKQLFDPKDASTDGVQPFPFDASATLATYVRDMDTRFKASAVAARAAFVAERARANEVVRVTSDTVAMLYHSVFRFNEYNMPGGVCSLPEFMQAGASSQSAESLKTWMRFMTGQYPFTAETVESVQRILVPALRAFVPNMPDTNKPGLLGSNAAAQLSAVAQRKFVNITPEIAGKLVRVSACLDAVRNAKYDIRDETLPALVLEASSNGYLTSVLDVPLYVTGSPRTVVALHIDQFFSMNPNEPWSQLRQSHPLFDYLSLEDTSTSQVLSLGLPLSVIEILLTDIYSSSVPLALAVFRQKVAPGERTNVQSDATLARITSALGDEFSDDGAFVDSIKQLYATTVYSSLDARYYLSRIPDERWDAQKLHAPVHIGHVSQVGALARRRVLDDGVLLLGPSIGSREDDDPPKLLLRVGFAYGFYGCRPAATGGYDVYFLPWRYLLSMQGLWDNGW